MSFNVEYAELTEYYGIVCDPAAGQYVDVSGAHIPTDSDFTLEIRVTVDSKIDDNGVLYSHSGRVVFYSNTNFGDANDQIRLWSSNSGQILVGPDIRDNQDHLISVVRSGSTFELYVDGTLEDTGSFSGSLHSSPAETNLGRDPENTGRKFEGLYGECRIWNVVRTSTEINDNLDTKFDGSESGLVHLWNIDEGSGTTLTDSAGSIDGTAQVDDWEAIFSNNQIVTGITNEYYDITGLLADTRYAARVQQENSDGIKSEWSSWVEFTTLEDTGEVYTDTYADEFLISNFFSIKVTRPASLVDSYQIVDNIARNNIYGGEIIDTKPWSFTLSWGSYRNATKYEVQYRKTSGRGLVGIKVTTEQEYTARFLGADRSYEWRMRAFVDDGSGEEPDEWTQWETVVTGGVTHTSTPSNVNSTVTNDELTLNWDAPAEGTPDNYEVEIRKV